MRKIILRFAFIILIPIGLFLIFLVYATLTEFRPPKETVIPISVEADTLTDSVLYSAMIWNIGYGGLGAGMDFFHDGGKQVRDTKKNVEHNIDQINKTIYGSDSIDFFMLQEVDIKSKRSYQHNELEQLSELLKDHTMSVGVNYDVGFVPVPPSSPLGKVRSGIVNFSRFVPTSSVRHAYEGNYSWPTSTFMLKRCFLVNRYPLDNGKEFILINTHNSAYDDGSLRAKQLEQLSDFVLGEYNKGNPVLIGGDWNQSPAGFIPKYNHVFDTTNVSYLPDTFLMGWQQGYSDKVPTNRRIISPYIPETTPTTVIDFYISSPNIKVLSLEVLDLDFENSDHQPVLITFTFTK